MPYWIKPKRLQKAKKLPKTHIVVGHLGIVTVLSKQKFEDSLISTSGGKMCDTRPSPRFSDTHHALTYRERAVSCQEGKINTTC